MDPAHRGWPPQPGGSSHGSADQSQAASSRPAFGAGQQSPPQGHSLPPPPPQSGPFPHFHQPAPSLANLAGISQTSPRQPPRPEAGQQQPPPGPQLPLPGFSQATGQPGAAERERERAREQQEIQIKEEEDRRHREQQDRQRLEQAPPHQTQQAQPIHLHQPVAVGPRTVHGPNGLLSNPPGPQPQLPLGAPSGPGNIFAGGPVQPATQPQGPGGQQMQPGLLMPFTPGAAQQPASQQQQVAQPAQAPIQGQGQGQQPILNDALSYLDQVKVQFADHPDVYNRFLDIMKDFKSGAIDTPGVIGRVSTLFAGNPDLIQGFNTFLPPGYRIECGADNDPNAIRVTTPMGSSIRPMPQPGRPLGDVDGAQDGMRPANGTSTPQPGQFAPPGYSPSGRGVGGAAPGPSQSFESARQQEQQQSIHQQEQRGVSSLQNAVSAATGGTALRAGISPRTTPLPGQQDPNAASDGQLIQAGLEKQRGPVEFNHAISYVNKIKNRFSAHPDIYKQFLEILQTYQRESKPIQDVYSQVTHLFKTAPDLLEDFKQFLPESAAHAKQVEMERRRAEEQAILSNVRNDGSAPSYTGSPVISREQPIGTPSHARTTNLPPVGNFAPTPNAKDNKRKRPHPATGNNVSIMDASGGAGSKAGLLGSQPAKRPKQTHQPAVKALDAPPSSPTLVPALPSPIPPTTTSAATHEELAFFDRAKKAIGNKNTMNEFLKLCNLFSQDFISRSTLIYRARAFIGSNPDLMKWFEEFVGYDGRDVMIENKARDNPFVPGGRINLSNCRAYSPSYRLLPKREKHRVCSGRDELCNSVLNDSWASHPTWASEDSGFIAHRKNMYEEGLHRIEEERHDYDYNIEACTRTIQLLEPIATHLRRMTLEEQFAYRLPSGLGGQSETIYRRVIMKLYGREKGQEVIQQLHSAPYQVIPVLLNRLKERLETWKMGQREWEKVWRDQTQKMFWKSLDHQAANQRTNDRRQFQTKALQGEVQVRFEEMRNADGKAKPGPNSSVEIMHLRGKPQVELEIGDVDVVVDATYLLLVHIGQDATDNPRLAPFVREFMPLFLGVDAEVFERKLREKLGETPVSGEENASGAEDSAGEKRGRKMGKTSLLKQTLDKGPKGKLGRKDREGSNASASRATTPDVASNDEAAGDSMAVDNAGTPAAEDGADAKKATEEAARRWLEHPVTENTQTKQNVDPNEPQSRDVFRLWASTPIFCFVRMFMHLYERLHRLKNSEADCRDAMQNAKKHKPANELGIMDKQPQDFFGDTSPAANYYKQMLGKFVGVLEGEIEFVNDGVEDCLRRFYLHSGYPLYAFEKMVQTLARYGAQMVTPEGANKDRSWEVLQLWRKDRVKGETSAVQSTDYRKAAEKLIGGAETYRIDWDESKKTAKIFLVKKDDPFYVDDDSPSARDMEDKWRYYIASYTSLEDTEGVDRRAVRPVLLLRNIHALGADPKSDTFALLDDAETTSSSVGPRLLQRFLAAKNDEMLVLRIAVNSYRPIFQPGTAEGFFEARRQREGGEMGVKLAEEVVRGREEVVKEGFEMVNGAMKGLTREEVEGRNKGWGRLVEGVGEGEGMEVDG